MADKKEKVVVDVVEKDEIYGGNPVVMADALENMANVRRMVKKRLETVEKNADEITDATATEKVRLQGTKETKAPALKPYTESFDVKDRAELSTLIEKAKKDKKKFKIGRSMKEGFRYTLLVESMIEEAKAAGHKVGDTIKIITMVGEPSYTGKVGKITEIDDAGQLHGTWGGLAVIPGEDQFELVTVINNDTGKVEEKKEVKEQVEAGDKELGTELTTLELAKELGKGTMWEITQPQYFNMWQKGGFQLFVKGEGDGRILTFVKDGLITKAVNVKDELVIVENLMGAKMMKPMMKEGGEEHHHDEQPKDEGEYDQEGDMAKSDLQIMADAALELHGMLEDEENLPEWVQAKITLASDYIDTARDYMKAKKAGKDFPEPKEDEHEEEDKDGGEGGEKEVALEPLEEAEKTDGKHKVSDQQLKDYFKHKIHKLIKNYNKGKKEIYSIENFEDFYKWSTQKESEAMFSYGFPKKEIFKKLLDEVISDNKQNIVEPLEEVKEMEEVLVEPKKGETEQEYVSRFMGSKQANKDFPNQKQRAAVAYSKFRGKKEELVDIPEPQNIQQSRFFAGDDGDVEAHIFADSEGLEDFDLRWDDKKGGYVLTWEVQLDEAMKPGSKFEKAEKTFIDLMKQVEADETPDSEIVSATTSLLRSLVSSKKMSQEEYDHVTKNWDEILKRHGMMEAKKPEVKKEEGKKPLEEKKLKEEAKLLSSLNEFEPWSGAVSTWELIVNANKVEQLDFLLEDMYPEGMTTTELNDILWFESDWVLDMLGISRDEVVSDEEEKEESEAEGEESEVEGEEDIMAMLNGLEEEEPVLVVLDDEELEESKHKEEKHGKEKHAEEKKEKHEMKEEAGSIVKEVQDFLAKTAKK